MIAILKTAKIMNASYTGIEDTPNFTILTEFVQPVERCQIQINLHGYDILVAMWQAQYLGTENQTILTFA